MSDIDTNLLRNTIASVQKPGWLMEHAAPGSVAKLLADLSAPLLAEVERLRTELATAHADARDADDAETLLRAWLAGNGDREKTQQWLAGENPWWREANADARALERATADAVQLRSDLDAAVARAERAEGYLVDEQQMSRAALTELGSIKAKLAMAEREHDERGEALRETTAALESLTNDLALAVGHTGAPADLLAELVSGSRLSITIPHVFDIDGQPYGVRHGLRLDGDKLTVSDERIDASGVAVAGERRSVDFVTAVHALLNASTEELDALGRERTGGSESELFFEPAPSPALDDLWPPCGPCAFCGGPDKRHRIWDVIAARHAAGESIEALAEDYEVTVEHIRAAIEHGSDGEE